MLLSFRFANHRSFRDEQQLNLVPIYEDAHFADPADQAVRVVGVFGANASGKSNFLHALAFARRLATNSDREVEPGMGLATDPFRLDEESTSEPSRYVVDLSFNGIQHTYGFSINRERILEEWLYFYPKGRKQKVFDRDEREFSWGPETHHSDIGKIADITAPTALLLSTVARFSRNVSTRRNSSDIEPLHQVYGWFQRLRNRGRANGFVSPTMMNLMMEHEMERAMILGLLRAADVGIIGVAITDETAVAENETELFESPSSEIDQPSPVARRGRRPLGKRIQFAHQGARGPAVLELEEESTGTRQVLQLAADASAILRAKRGTLTIDEIDASLHPMLTAQLIRLFQNPVTNPGHSQLIFTSHDAALLGSFDGEEVLHRDQIWFAEKDSEGASTVYPLSDFKPRKTGENRQRRYLNGNYGGVPDLAADSFERALDLRGDPDAPE